MPDQLIPSSEQIGEFELEEIERRAAQLLQKWMTRTIWDLEELSTGDLPAAAETARQASQVIEVLEQITDGAERVRELLG